MGELEESKGPPEIWEDEFPELYRCPACGTKAWLGPRVGFLPDYECAECNTEVDNKWGGWVGAFRELYFHVAQNAYHEYRDDVVFAVRNKPRGNAGPGNDYYVRKADTEIWKASAHQRNHATKKYGPTAWYQLRTVAHKAWESVTSSMFGIAE